MNARSLLILRFAASLALQHPAMARDIARIVCAEEARAAQAARRAQLQSAVRAELQHGLAAGETPDQLAARLCAALHELDRAGDDALAAGGGNPYHDDLGRFTTGPGGGLFHAPDHGGSSGASSRGESAGYVHPLDESKPIVTNDLAELMRTHPDHPVTKAFKKYFETNAVSKAEAKQIDHTLRRLPPYRPAAPLFRGLSADTAEDRDKLAQEIRTAEPYPMNNYINSGSKDSRIATAFAAQRGPGVMLVVTHVNNSARDVEPLVKVVAPHFAHQQEVMFLKGSKFKVTGEKEISTRSGGAPAFTLEEE